MVTIKRFKGASEMLKNYKELKVWQRTPSLPKSHHREISPLQSCIKKRPLSQRPNSECLKQTVQPRP